ncbi:MAG: septation protein A [Salinisphaeraceae bacterium]|jgi:intracellular septation protein|nr:septation protein A [Salinisphaeraceae bacterium]
MLFDCGEPSSGGYNYRMKALMEYLPIIAFVGAYALTDIYIATGVFMVAATVLALGTRMVTGEWNKMQLAVAAMAVAFGGLTLGLRDPNFIKIKPTVLYAVFGLALVASAYIGKKPLMQRAMGSQLDLPDDIWRRLTFIWAGFFFACGIINLYVAYAFSEAFWVNFKLFGMLGLTVLFVIAQGFYLAPHISDSEQS